MNEPFQLTIERYDGKIIQKRFETFGEALRYVQLQDLYVRAIHIVDLEPMNTKEAT